MHLTLNQLRTFQSVVRLGSFHKAARELGLTQPSVSMRIRELEEALEAMLFERQGPSLRLTAEGQALVDYAERVLEATGELIERFTTRDPLKGTLRLGVSESFAIVCLPELLRRLEQRYPGIRVTVLVGDMAVRQRLEAQGLDIAIAYEPAVGPRVNQESLGRCEFVWVAAMSYPMPRRTLPPDELCRHHLIVPPPPAPLNDAVRKWFAEVQIRPERVSTCNNVSAIVSAVLHGSAIGFLPKRIIEDRLTDSTVKVVNVSPAFPSQPVSICYHANEFGESVKAFVGLTREVAAQYRLFQ